MELGGIGIDKMELTPCLPKIIGFVEDIIPQQTGFEFRKDFR